MENAGGNCEKELAFPFFLPLFLLCPLFSDSASSSASSYSFHIGIRARFFEYVNITIIGFFDFIGAPWTSNEAYGSSAHLKIGLKDWRPSFYLCSSAPWASGCLLVSKWIPCCEGTHFY